MSLKNIINPNKKGYRNLKVDDIETDTLSVNSLNFGKTELNDYEKFEIELKAIEYPYKHQPTSKFTFTKIGDLVNLQVKKVISTSVGGTNSKRLKFDISDFVRFLPKDNLRFVVSTIDFGNNSLGIVDVHKKGSITIGTSVSQNCFSNAKSTGFYTFNISYNC